MVQSVAIQVQASHAIGTDGPAIAIPMKKNKTNTNIPLEISLRSGSKKVENLHTRFTKSARSASNTGKTKLLRCTKNGRA